MNEKYLEAVKIIKTAILRSQNRAAKYTNTEMLSLYYYWRLCFWQFQRRNMGNRSD